MNARGAGKKVFHLDIGDHFRSLDIAMVIGGEAGYNRKGWWRCFEVSIVIEDGCGGRMLVVLAWI